MKDGFKESLSRINNLMWVIITISIGLLLFEPKSQNLSVLGIQISVSRLFFVAPVILIATQLARQDFIRNIIHLIQITENRSELREIVLSYPLVEFMRWKFKSGIEIFLLTVFQVSFESIPGLSLFVFYNGVNELGFWSATIVLLIGFIAVSNYSLLRWKVYQPLIGRINTPD